MPRHWHDRHAIFDMYEDEEERRFQLSISADKKPYFMRYIYPDLMREYNTFIRNTNRNALRKFQTEVSDMRNAPADELTDEQRTFLKYYDIKMPVGLNGCVMNKICRRFEEKFDGYFRKLKDGHTFDYSILKSGAEYTDRQFTAIRKLYQDYQRRISSYSVFADYERVDSVDAFAALSDMNDEFRKECFNVCSNEQALCDIILDICYKSNNTKRFAWDMCGDQIIRNLLHNKGSVINYPQKDKDGDLTFRGERFSMTSVEYTEVQ